ncbi:MAG TPA: AAA family ATPase [Candidatus Dormibacteraeota bacterium]|nr:AAA family ATPase [Candidatus Dormibacteraeota bacterium]
MSGARRIFLAATGQNRGKTTTSLGLAAAIAQRGHRLGFLKPIGQRYLVVDGTRADEDAVLMKAVFDLPDALNDMSPVTLPRHFTTDYVLGRIDEDLEAAVVAADRTVAADKDLVLIEGTGHAGVGAVIGLSNARVASLLDAPVIIVSEGGVGRPIDEIVLNQALFERHRVRILGAVVNKVDVAAAPHLPDVLARGLAQHGVQLLGCIPYSQFLANPSLELIATHLQGELLTGEATPGQTIGQVAIGAMQAEHAVPLLRDRTLLITPGDREDLLMAAVVANRDMSGVRGPRVTGIVMTGGFRPPARMLSELRAANLFAYLVETDTYSTAQAVNEILVKTHPSDTEKIATIIDLVGGALDADALLARL